MDVIGKRVRGIHAKDALFRRTRETLEVEVPIGERQGRFRPQCSNGLKMSTTRANNHRT